MAARRPQVGLRRRGPGLSKAAWVLPTALALVATGCFGLDEQEQAQLTVHQQNSQDFFQRGAYAQALHQADMALRLDDDLVGMRLLKGFCLTKIGKLADRPERLDEALVIFDELIDSDGDENYRIWLGAGQAHLARGLVYDDDIERIERRLTSDFLSERGREEEQANLAYAESERMAHFDAAERKLRRVLEFEFQGDNPYVLVELVVALNSIGGREDEVIHLSHAAVEQLQESTQLTRATLRKSLQMDPTGQLTLQRRIDENLEKERMLRDIVVTIELNRGAYQAALQELAILEERQIMLPSHYGTRAGVYETIGMYAEAITDLETLLRLRAREAEYDDVAAEIFERIDTLRRAARAGD